MDRVAYDVSTTSSQESGIALEIKFESLNSSLNSFAQKVENLERSAWALATESLGLPKDIITISYNLDFSIRDLASDITTIDSINAIMDLPKLRAEGIKRVSGEFFKGADDVTMDAIIDEIDNTAKVAEVE